MVVAAFIAEEVSNLSLCCPYPQASAHTSRLRHRVIERLHYFPA